MHHKLPRRPLRGVLWWVAATSAVVTATSCFVRERYSAKIFPAAQVPDAPVAIVFGAGLAAKGKPSPMLAERLTTMQPSLSVLFGSGYYDTHVVQMYLVKKGFELLTKPWTLDTLGQKIHEILVAPPPADGS